MTKHAASSAELTAVCQRLAAHYTALAEKESARGAAGYARLDKERVQCLRLLESCLDSQLWEEVQDLVGELHVYLDRQGYWIEEVAALEMNLIAARQEGDCKDEEGWSLNNLGYTCWRLGEHDKGLSYLNQSVTIAREIGDKKKEGISLNNIALIYKQQGKHEQALQYYKQDLAICIEGGDRKGEGITMNNIAMVYYAKGDYKAALQYYEKCLQICREVEHKNLEGTILNNIGTIYRVQDNPAKALEYYHQALVIRQDVGDRYKESITRWNIGLACEDQGDLARAEEYIRQAVCIAEDGDHPDLEEYREGLERVRAARCTAQETVNV